MTVKRQIALLRLWHAWLAGGFLVAYLTGDENTYAMHFFAGYAVVAALAVRLAAGLLAPQGSLWRLPRPSLSPGKGRNPLFAWLAAAVLAGVGLSAVSGALADPIHALEDLHEGLSEFSLWPILLHTGFILYIHGGRRLLGRLREATT